jgi:hypothetical protein
MADKKDRNKAAIVKRLSEVRIVEIACKSVGISRATYYRWLKEDAKFADDCVEAIALGTQTICDLAESQIVTKIRSGDFRASTYFLEKHHPEYIPKPRTNPPQPRRYGMAAPDEPMDDKQIDLMIKTLEAIKEPKAEKPD